MRATIAKRYSFDAAHHLPDHDGKCRRLHGHTYGVEVVLEGEIRDEPGHPKNGMVVDYGEVDDVLKPVLATLDHQDLNQLISLANGPTTAENIALWLARLLRDQLPGLREVRVSETPSTWASIRVR